MATTDILRTFGDAVSETHINDIINLINEYKYDEIKTITFEIYGLLHNGVDPTLIINDLQNERFGWSSGYYDTFIKDRKFEDDLLENPPEVREGETECPKCKQKKTRVIEMQTRSADEGFTYYIQCCNPQCKQLTRQK